MSQEEQEAAEQKQTQGENQEGADDSAKSPQSEQGEESQTHKSDNEDQSQQAEAAKNGSDGETLPFHKNPEVQKYLQRQVDRHVSRKEKEWQKKYQDLTEQYTQRLESVATNGTSKSKPDLSPEEENALMLLADRMFSNPQIIQKYGLDKVTKLEQQLNNTSQEQSREAYEGEMSNVISTYAEQYGYDAEELREDLEEFISNDPWLAGKEYSKGSLGKIAKLFFSDKGKELAERETNLRLIKEKKAKQNQATETKSDGKNLSKKNLPKKMEDFLDDKIREEGGIAF